MGYNLEYILSIYIHAYTKPNRQITIMPKKKALRCRIEDNKYNTGITFYR